MRCLWILMGVVGVWASAGGVARAGSNSLVFLQAAGEPELDDNALVEAVKIYTRDLGIELDQRPGAPEEVTSQSLGALSTMVRSSGIRGVFWYRIPPEATSDAIMYVIARSDGDPTISALRIGGIGSPGFYRVMALKLRAVLTGSADFERQEPTPPPTPPSPSPPVASRSEPLKPPAVIAPPRPSERNSRLLVSVGYRLTLPFDPTLLRHGIGVEVAVPFTRHWQAHLSIDVSSESSRTVSSGMATLSDVPLRAGVRALVSRGRLTLGASALVGLHVFSISAIGFDGTHGGSLNAAVSLGGLLVGSVRLTQKVAAEIRFSAEEVLPDIHFLLHRQFVFAAGGPLFVFGTGLAFAAL